jgi:hypothetical protein
MLSQPCLLSTYSIHLAILCLAYDLLRVPLFYICCLGWIVLDKHLSALPPSDSLTPYGYSASIASPYVPALSPISSRYLRQLTSDMIIPQSQLRLLDSIGKGNPYILHIKTEIVLQLIYYVVLFALRVTYCSCVIYVRR